MVLGATAKYKKGPKPLIVAKYFLLNLASELSV